MLRFLDNSLERRYQQAAGEDGLAGFRTITGASGLPSWSVAAGLSR